VSSRSPHACRAFEERLMARLDLDSGPFPVDPHAAECPSCAALVEEVLAESALLARMKRPEAPELLARLAEPPSDFAARRAAAPVLELLEPGRLKPPEPSSELMGRLFFLPTRGRLKSAAPRADVVPPAGFAARMRWLFSDWRVTVATAYAVTLLFVTLLKVDPMSVARNTAQDIGSAGQRAIAEAAARRDDAVKRLASSSFAEAAKPLTSRLEYRLYRSVTAVKARASAYSTLVFEKVFGGTLEARDHERARDAREPRDPSLRS
jgi:hypothetical protein